MRERERETWKKWWLKEWLNWWLILYFIDWLKIEWCMCDGSLYEIFFYQKIIDSLMNAWFLWFCHLLFIYLSATFFECNYNSLFSIFFFDFLKMAPMKGRVCLLCCVLHHVKFSAESQGLCQTKWNWWHCFALARVWGNILKGINNIWIDIISK